MKTIKKLKPLMIPVAILNDGGRDVVYTDGPSLLAAIRSVPKRQKLTMVLCIKSERWLRKLPEE